MREDGLLTRMPSASQVSGSARMVSISGNGSDSELSGEKYDAVNGLLTLLRTVDPRP
ncbi:hypothetical protein [Actinomadura monticuli]|uniref:DUF397 domain-containing protein n=1 Tax=Actinomadura monticuli TaxID=3097367 RepID=A0ABV4Q5H5_9ACTN